MGKPNRDKARAERLVEIARSRGLSKASDLEGTVDTSFHGYDQMVRMAARMGATVNQTYGGYIGQPITVDEHGDSMEVYGRCQLKSGYCSHNHRPQTADVDACTACPVYKAQFGQG